MEKLSDEQLMEAFGKGDQNAFALLYSRHKDALYRYFLRQGNNTSPARAEEMYQEVWFKVIDQAKRYKPEAKFTTWLYRIAHNLLIDEYRKQMSESSFQQQTEEPEILHSDSGEQESQALSYCLSKLPLHQKEAFMLRHNSDFSPVQISDIVGAKPEAVKTRLRYAMQQLRDCLTRKLGAEI
ncbi:sigma-70 family RNA polymerase sigma factor [Vibrio sp. SCSIO 43137]|uniref:sigma-70 family RNA polymerase sigma factor n=1 Tax=Vibrio sp. SCSIO 43137 TaxID=3021011 RepID=UPI0023077602|nr:sigma-70 family RNA polymerase sigma factor [Vibrio sp. SCSIO 43137]WCE29561.1 sigma-70 family RNA polymerase sigma factor [Vibrio sp. SCSIO 43137]